MISNREESEWITENDKTPRKERDYYIILFIGLGKYRYKYDYSDGHLRETRKETNRQNLFSLKVELGV